MTRDDLAELIGYTYHTEFSDPAGKTADAILAKYEVTEKTADETLIGRQFTSRDWRERGRTLTVLRVSDDQTRAGKPAKSTVYDCRDGDRIVRIQAHILRSKWKDVTRG